MDCLSDVLSTVRLQGTIYCQAEFSAPWGLAVGTYPGHTGFLMIVRGSCLMQVKGETPMSLTAGDLVLSPMGLGYHIKDAIGSEVAGFEDIENQIESNGHHKLLRHGGGGQQTHVIMGCFQFDASDENPLLNSLPEILYVKAEELASEPWLDTTFRFISSETAHERQGTDVVISRLTELLFIQAIRAHISQMKNCPTSTGWLKAIGDAQIGRALNLIHEKPEAPWTVQTLAQAVNMSRSSFAAKFTALLGSAPLDYLTSWRMQKAQDMLRRSNGSLAEIAARIGYQSEPAFRKAFKRVTGNAPGQFRKEKVV